MSAFALLLAAIPKQKTALRAVLLFPVFMASWLPLNLVSLLFRTRVWKEIEHGSSGENVKTLFQKNSQPVFRLAVWMGKLSLLGAQERFQLRGNPVALDCFLDGLVVRPDIKPVFQQIGERIRLLLCKGSGEVPRTRHVDIILA